MRTMVLVMPLATTHSGPHTALELLRSKGYLVPLLLLAGIVGIGLAGVHRGDPILPVASSIVPLEAADANPAPVSVHCNLRQGFVLQLIMNVKIMARSIVLPAHHQPGERSVGARCLVQMGRRAGT